MEYTQQIPKTNSPFLFRTAGGRSLPSTRTAYRQHDSASRLTPRQLQVVRLLCQGMTNKGIANALGCSPRTVEFHISCMFRTFGLETRSALVVYAVTHQLNTVPIET